MPSFQVKDLRACQDSLHPFAAGLGTVEAAVSTEPSPLGSLGVVEPHCHGEWRMREIDFCGVHSLRFWGFLVTTVHPSEA